MNNAVPLLDSQDCEALLNAGRGGERNMMVDATQCQAKVMPFTIYSELSGNRASHFKERRFAVHSLSRYLRGSICASNPTHVKAHIFRVLYSCRKTPLVLCPR